jgi:hypothetical protein
MRVFFANTNSRNFIWIDTVRKSPESRTLPETGEGGRNPKRDISGRESSPKSQHGYRFRDGKDGALALNPKPAFGFTAAANPVSLPKPEPRTMREHFVVLSIRSQEVARTQRSEVPQREDALNALDLGNGLLGIHSVSISSMSVAIVKQSRICVSTVARWSHSLR